MEDSLSCLLLLRGNLLVNKSIISLILLHSYLIFPKRLSTAPLLALILPLSSQNLSSILRELSFNSLSDQSSAMSVYWFGDVWYLNLPSLVYLWYHYISNICKTGRDGTPTYIISGSNTGIFATNHHFRLLTIYSQPFQLWYFFPQLWIPIQILK